MTQPQPDPWTDFAVITTHRLWGYRREALLITVILIPWLLLPTFPAAVITIGTIAMWWKWLLPWLHISHVRRQWADAVISAGAADPPPKRSRKAQTLHGPKVVRARVTTIGDELLVRVGRGRGTVESLTEHRQQLAADLDHRFSRVLRDGVRVEPTDRANRAKVTIVRRDPFQNAAPTPWPLSDAPTTSVWDPLPFGTYDTGEPVQLSTMGGHVLIAGATGSGKSVAAQMFIAQAALDPTAQLVLLDPNVLQFSRWEPCAAAPVIGSDIAEATRALEATRDVMDRRFDDLRAGRKERVGPGDYTVHVFIDELSHYAQDKQFVAVLLNLIQRGRAAGVRIVAVTQRPSAEILRTDVRAQFSHRILFRVMEPETTRMVVGTTDIPAHRIPTQGYEGVGYLGTDAALPQRFRAHLLTEPEARDIASRATASRAESELQDILTEAATEAAAPPETTTDPDSITPLPPNPPASPASSRRQPRRSLAECLPTEGDGLTRAEWAELTKRGSWKYLADDAAVLLEHGWVVQTGAGRGPSPFRYRRNAAAPLPDDGAQGANNPGGFSPPQRGN